MVGLVIRGIFHVVTPSGEGIACRSLSPRGAKQARGSWYKREQTREAVTGLVIQARNVCPFSAAPPSSFFFRKEGGAARSSRDSKSFSVVVFYFPLFFLVLDRRN